ncbi:UNVERIFIED_CONTAM: hypothetical protein GTU68_040486 [Idotea baltica]|nr:hypothetical protein [Idotea baltica]
MLFNSYIFVLAFLPLILLLWWNRRITTSVRLGLLTFGSYLFYGWWDYRFVGLLVVSTVIDFYVGGRIHDAHKSSARRSWLSLSLLSNLGLLAFFKYSGFFAASLNSVAGWLRVGGEMPVPEVILPIGISFYTFQTLSYSIDIYRRDAEPAESIWHFAAYVSLFPQLIAGPIVRYREMDQQLRSVDNRVNWSRFLHGILFFVIGMVQKVLLADTIAERINPLFADYQSLQLCGAWFAMLGYTCQLYFDFCGYSNMAVGLGRMLGFEFPQNFDSPYKSANIAEFWRRWHMTLSFFLRDYLFIPLGGSRYGQWLTLRNLTVVMFLGGLWHGAGWTFVVWGLFHGLMLVIHSVAGTAGTIRLPHVVNVAITFVFVVVGWTIFRSTDMAMCFSLLSSMSCFNGLESDVVNSVGGIKSIAVLAGLLAIVFLVPNIWQLQNQSWWRRLPATEYWAAATLSMVFVICVLRFDADSPFLYFQF